MAVIAAAAAGSNKRGRASSSSKLCALVPIIQVLCLVALVATIVAGGFPGGGDLLEGTSSSSSQQQFASTADTGTSTSAAHFPLILSKRQSPINLLEQDGKFRNENCDKVKHIGHESNFGCRIEWDEWMLVNAFVQPGDVVIEFGARFGTTSCILSRAVGLDGAVIAVEPDSQVHTNLLQNNFHNQCGVHFVLGTVGEDTMYIPTAKARSNYAISTMTATEKMARSASSQRLNPADNKEDEMEAVPHISRADIEAAVGQKINVALIDCEGCIGGIQEIFDHVDVVLMEEDGPSYVEYKSWHKTLIEKNFECAWYIRDTSAPEKRWSQEMRHSAWIRKGVQGRADVLSCPEYRDKIGLDKATELICDQCPTAASIGAR